MYRAPGNSGIPSVVGLIIAGEVVKDLTTKEMEEARKKMEEDLQKIKEEQTRKKEQTHE